MDNFELNSSSTADDSSMSAYSPSSTAANFVEMEEECLRPPAVFRKGYNILTPYEDTKFGGIVLKKTKNGHRIKSGVQIDGDLSPKRR
jgi:hypothetical protein